MPSLPTGWGSDTDVGEAALPVQPPMEPLPLIVPFGGVGQQVHHSTGWQLHLCTRIAIGKWRMVTQSKGKYKATTGGQRNRLWLPPPPVAFARSFISMDMCSLKNTVMLLIFWNHGTGSLPYCMHHRKD
jgi:hypothetical protein